MLRNEMLRYSVNIWNWQANQPTSSAHFITMSVIIIVTEKLHERPKVNSWCSAKLLQSRNRRKYFSQTWQCLRNQCQSFLWDQVLSTPKWSQHFGVWSDHRPEMTAILCEVRTITNCRTATDFQHCYAARSTVEYQLNGQMPLMMTPNV